MDGIATLPTFSMVTDEEIAAASFLARYRGETRKLYMSDLRIYFDWCARHGLKPLQVERAHVEFFARHLEEERQNMPASVARRLNTLRAFYRIVVADGRMDRDPTIMLKMPKVIFDEARTLGLDRIELGNLIQTARSSSPDKEALITLMGLLSLRRRRDVKIRGEPVDVVIAYTDGGSGICFVPDVELVFADEHASP